MDHNDVQFEIKRSLTNKKVPSTLGTRNFKYEINIRQNY